MDFKDQKKEIDDYNSEIIPNMADYNYDCEAVDYGSTLPPCCSQPIPYGMMPYCGPAPAPYYPEDNDDYCDETSDENLTRSRRRRRRRRPYYDRPPYYPYGNFPFWLWWFLY